MIIKASAGTHVGDSLPEIIFYVTREEAVYCAVVEEKMFQIAAKYLCISSGEENST